MTKEKSYIRSFQWSDTIRLRSGMYLPQTQKGFVENLKRIVSIVASKYAMQSCSIEVLGDTRLRMTFKQIQEAIPDYWAIMTSTFGDDDTVLELFTFNALSEHFKIDYYDKDLTMHLQQFFHKGILKKGTIEYRMSPARAIVRTTQDRNGTW